jgi:hypothetical protein
MQQPQTHVADLPQLVLLDGDSPSGGKMFAAHAQRSKPSATPE